ncbi:DUF305 domain-containing protein [Streptomyces thermolilacinus]|uniref:DUF305 domain-containing protein n=1 Tax=Streptomyces thermolilacinus SPC6 TaxID=1306406 RepID=A0A1D3E108_9ACTN|nr:DUF305 domain-containing protein [Streptomyces thermolilacinus SPC6]
MVVTRTGPGGRTLWLAAGVVVLALLFAGWATLTALGRDGGGSSASAAAVPGDDSADAGFARDMSVHHQQAVEMSFIVRDRTDDDEVRRLAYDIANTQANQRGMMLGWLDLWGLPKTAPDREPMAWMGGGHGSSHDGHGASPEAGHGNTHGGHDGGHGAAHGGGGSGGSGGQVADGGALMPGMATKAELERLRSADGVAAEVLYLQLMIDHHKGGVDMAQGCADACRVDVQRNLAQGMVDAQQSEINLMTDLLAKRGAKPRG